jgi:protein-tyrosine phosphatase
VTSTLTEPTRHLPFEGTFNVRDVGGYATADGRRTRWRTLLRADSLHRLSEAAQLQLVDMGLRTAIDLRRASEVADCPNVFCRSRSVRYRALPVFDDVAERGAPRSLEATYRHALDTRQPQLRAIVGALASPRALPALVHCTAGKDRTGLVIALLLELAGVSRETVVEDYALSGRYLGERCRDEARARPRPASPGRATSTCSSARRS